ncbi:MAG TPA: carboxypeptidase regulatory-like domain-containing protein [Pyrinomonadaceae bacterium]|nr:carboxypeptidase regulatory-like domain-containing protein [Pyrinomonadaceae bacterium]
MKRAQFWLAVCAMALLLLLSIACGKKAEDSSDATDNSNGGTTAGTKYAKSGNEGTISGKVAFNGTAPEPKKIDTSADAVCAQKNPNAVTEDTVVKDGKVANTFVYIKDGTTADGKKIGDFSFDAPTTAAVLDQNGCHYKPHVLGVQTNQKISITNSDPTQHNIHPTPKNNQEWNQSQGSGAPPIEKSFAKSEVMVPVKCNQHPWMKAYIGVLKHPFFAVTKEDGTYSIAGVPPGKYTVVAWHEKFGEKTMEVNVPSKGSATADYAFDAPAATAIKASSLQVLPALDIPMLAHH